MKKLFSLFIFVFVMCTITLAQGNGPGNNGNGNGFGNGNGNGNNGQGLVLPQAPGGVSWASALRILWAASPAMEQQQGLTYGQLILRYLQGSCTITLIATNPPTNNTYRVSYGGSNVIVVIQE
jgi:hypothetical protein